MLRTKKFFFVKVSLFALLILTITLSCNENKRTVISIIGEDSATLDAFKDLKSEYESLANVEINIAALPFDEAMEKSNLDLANKTGLYDIILQYNFSLSSFVRNDYVFELDELQTKDAINQEIENDIFQKDWEEVGYYYKDYKNPEHGIKKVGYPFASNTMLLTYNRQMFGDKENQANYKEKHGKELAPPKTWEEFRDIAEFFTDPAKDQYGVCVEGSDQGWLYYHWTNFAFGHGGKVMDKQRGWEGDLSTPVLLNSPEIIQATKLFVDLKPFNKGSFFDVDLYSQKELIKEGNVAMSIIWSDGIYSLIGLEDGEFDDRFGFAPIPGKVSMLAGGAFFINKSSKSAQDAFKFIMWLFDKKNQISMVKDGLCPPRISVYDAPEVQNIPYLQALKTSLNRGVYMCEAGPDADLISQKITTYVQKAWRGEITPEEAMSMAQNDIDEERPKIFEQIQ